MDIPQVKPKDFDELEPETREIAVFASQMRERNAATIAEIEAMGGGVDVATARLEHILFSLVELGIITDKQLWQMQADWEKALKAQLRQAKEHLIGLRQAAAEQERADRFAKKLIVPGR